VPRRRGIIMKTIFSDPSLVEEEKFSDDFLVINRKKAINGYNAFKHPHSHPDVIDDSLESPSPKKKGFLAFIKKLVVTKKKKK
jgi:hypothetical protein